MTLEIFRDILLAEGILGDDLHEIYAEIGRILTAGDEKAYLRMSRVGAYVPLNRPKRREIYAMYERAKKLAHIKKALKEVA